LIILEEGLVMKDIKFGYGVVLVMAAIVLGSIACTNHTIPERGGMCEKCHTDYDRLVEVHSPDTGTPAGGCGGDAIVYEPYDRVYMGGDGFEDFKESGHYAVGCTGCHNGNGDTQDKDLAHSGDFINHPSMFYADKCGNCHQEITEDFATSLHHGTGQKRKVAMRSGLDGPQDFDQLHPNKIEGYNKNCAHCHGTCGNCHVVRPPVGGGGLASGHNFNKTPHMRNVCITCHVSRGGHAYLGVDPDTEPDVHQSKLKFTCLDCHSGHELHGDGEPVDQRYAYSKLPTCESDDCHGSVSKSNLYHRTHYADFNCQVCHSQEYNNCGSCHIHGEGARVPAYMDFKIAMNPIPDVKDEYEFALVRRTLAAPDNWEKYHVDDYENFNAFPVYNYTTPHNILKRTERTPEQGGCNSGCHIRMEGNDTINKTIYLWQEDLGEDWELESTSYITVDGELPSDWFE
jgi:hypothetical protein